MNSRDVIVIGGSAGGIEALCTVLSGLPADLAASVYAVLHTAPESPGLLAKVLQRCSQLPIRVPEDRHPITQGEVCVAPPDHHLLLARDTVRVFRGPRENRQRPAIDVLFRSAARVFGPRVIGVVLTGYLDDGSAGLVEIKRHGGVAIVEDPDTAKISGMPSNALRHVAADYCLPVSGIAAVLKDLVSTTSAGERDEKEVAEAPGPPTGLTCPECGGAIWELHENDTVGFRCRVGHRYSPESMFVDQDSAVERALWAAMRVLEERSQLSERMAARAAARNSLRSEKHFRNLARESRANARMIRGMLLERPEQEEVVEAQNPLISEAS